jgi:flagellar motor switch/type III secretory pathway protein FliN
MAVASVTPALNAAPAAQAGGGTEPQKTAAQIDDPRWRPVLALPCQLTVDLPLPGFKVADFLNLRAGSVISTHCRVTHDVPLRANGTVIAWAELEGSGKRLAVRLTEMA